MDFGNFDFPCTVDINVFKAYFNIKPLPGPQPHKRIQTLSLNWDACQPRTLRKLALEKIIENWTDVPYFQEIPRQADRNFILTNLSPDVPLKISSVHIKEDFFWKKSFLHRWKIFPVATENRPWISIYMEKHLQEYLENTEVCDYDQEAVQTVLDICAPYINKLQIDLLQPSMGERNDHIPLDFVLSNLPELRFFRVTYCTKTIGTNFYLGCSLLSRNDVVSFARGLSHCSELTEFWLHSVKLEPEQLAFISRSLDKGCQHLKTLAITHCCMHDDGLQLFLDACTRESFAGLTTLDLTNNYISPEGAFTLSRVLRGRPIERLVLRLNPIESDGVAAVFAAVQHLPLIELDISGCSITNTITKLLLHLIVQNKTILRLDVSNNDLGTDLGQKVLKVMGFNEVMQRLDLRNTGVTVEDRNTIKAILRQNKAPS